jgi:F-type H+-transporting ATPase subunit a
MNKTVVLALLTSIAYFYAGLRKKGNTYFKRAVEPAAFLLPIDNKVTALLILLLDF